MPTLPDYIRLDIPDPTLRRQVTEALTQLFSIPEYKASMEAAYRMRRQSPPYRLEDMEAVLAGFDEPRWIKMTPSEKQQLLQQANAKKTSLTIATAPDVDRNMFFPLTSTVYLDPESLHTQGYHPASGSAAHPFSLQRVLEHKTDHWRDPLTSMSCLRAAMALPRPQRDAVLEQAVRARENTIMDRYYHEPARPNGRLANLDIPREDILLHPSPMPKPAQPLTPTPIRYDGETSLDGLRAAFVEKSGCQPLAPLRRGGPPRP